MADWQMYDDEGNATVTKMMYKIKDALKTQPLPAIRNLLHQGIKEVGNKHEEIYDTDVCNTIANKLTEWGSSIHEIKIYSDYWDL
jgi:hypothetical protein